MTMAACVEEVAAVRDGLGLDPFHVLGHSGGRLARPRVRPKPPEGLAGGRCVSSHGRACGIVAGRGAAVRSQPGGCCLAVPSAHADVCDLTVGGSSRVVPAALSFPAKTDHDRA